jgi:hypothetical protein
LVARKINLALPQALVIKLAWKVQCPVDIRQSILHTKYNLKKKPPFQPPTLHPKVKRKKTKAPWEDIALPIG